jgi:hypothetical protein
MLYDTAYSRVLEVHKLVHDPANPKDTADYVGIYSQMNGVPANGTVYTFSRRGTTSVKENAANNLSVYPNPVTSGKLFIDTKTALVNPRFTLINSLGQAIQLQDVSTHHVGYEIALPDGLQNGIYFLKIAEGENTVYSAKVQVNK